ncbi:MAG: 2,3-diphosphoglycerate-dependent phosphoglycerate mutase [Parcubacteria group bacterium]|nr:2,3-diphosphoglycerate-dependent phosphoglycerate mutase [Parcubacteria group bacterium]
MYKVVFLRHGESAWNQENKFTGWVNCGLSERGIQEAKEAAQVLKEKGFVFDMVFVSWLRRAIETMEIVLREMDLMNIEVEKSWKLNERFYGSLQGLNKSETARKYGEGIVHTWRRSWKIKPPALKKTDKFWPGNDPMYKDLDKKELPFTESLKDTSKRVLPYWKKEIVPKIKDGKHILVSGHGSGIRALVKYFDDISDKDIDKLNIPTGIPLVYEFNKRMKPIKSYYLADDNKVRAAIEVVKNQTKL